MYRKHQVFVFCDTVLSRTTGRLEMSLVNIHNSVESEWISLHVTAVTRMDTPKYGETLKFMYIKYQPILVVLPKVYQV